MTAGIRSLIKSFVCDEVFPPVKNMEVDVGKDASHCYLSTWQLS